MINIRELIDQYEAEGYSHDLAVQMAREEYTTKKDFGEKNIKANPPNDKYSPKVDKKPYIPVWQLRPNTGNRKGT